MYRNCKFEIFTIVLTGGSVGKSDLQLFAHRHPEGESEESCFRTFPKSRKTFSSHRIASKGLNIEVFTLFTLTFSK
jgi:hypothetical protein